MFGARRSFLAVHQVFLVMSVLALALRIFIPPGFMPAAATNGLPFAIVLCTGEGVLTVQPGGVLPGHADDEQDAPESIHDAPCVFSGQALAAATPILQVAGSAAYAAYLAPVPPTSIGLAPGRGLSGPPLPARGPPTLLI